MTSMKENVERGARLLDEKNPGWAEKVNLDTLAMGSCNVCVLGNVYGHYLKGCSNLGLQRCETKHGFYIEVISSSKDWDVLADLWREEIKLRLVHPEYFSGIPLSMEV